MRPIICLMGPTASGKTAAAIELVQRFPADIISVDSAMIYRGMDVGTAKPSAEELALAPHRLIDICDPSESYSAAQFVQDAQREIADIHAAGRVPLLVGGTMLYFRALLYGMAELPLADPAVRAQLTSEAETLGWPALHERLAELDPASHARIKPHDGQRIQRALEVVMLTGKPLSTLWQTTQPSAHYQATCIAIAPEDRAVLHERIATRFKAILAGGLMAETQALYDRGDLNVEMPSIRCVGYRQAWQVLAGELSQDALFERGVIATRQLAKRQLTWLRQWPDPIKWTRTSTEIISIADTLLSV